ncbi:MAG: IS1595 family transposase [bacterium]|nr:IS1595 family transposase [bacterium]
MKTKAPTLRQIQDRFPTEDSCLDHLMRVRFGDRHDCAKCGRNAHFYRVKARRSYACEYCGGQVYPTAGTPFDKTRTPLRDWFFVMFQFCASRNGVAAKEVERQLGVTYKTAWRMCHMIREYMGAVDGNGPIGGFGKIVEIDETYIGGKVENKGTGNYRMNKVVVIGMRERGGDVITQIVPNRKRTVLEKPVFANVKPHTEIHTDELISYNNLGDFKGYWHKTVNHSLGEYVGPTGTTVNGLEGFWAQLKRGINGTHIRVSAKHLPKYLGEFEYRHNMRRTPHLMLDRLMVSFAR